MKIGFYQGGILMNFFKGADTALSRIDEFSAFLTVGSSEKINPMTIGWAQIGIACGKPVMTVMVRQSRFSKKLIDENPVFTVSIPKDSSFKSALAFCGSKSGRDFDKAAECNLKTEKSDFISVPGISGCMIYECKVIYTSEMSESFTADSEREKWYKNGDYHTLYTGEILNIKGE